MRRTITGEALACIHIEFGTITRDELQTADEKVLIPGLSYLRGPVSNSSFVPVGKARITVELQPDADVAAAAVEALRDRKASILAEAADKANKIEEQIQSLLAITHNPTKEPA